jgi:hypothetical protein
MLAGEIDAVSMFDRALSASEISQLAGEQAFQIREDDILHRLTKEQREERERLLLQLSQRKLRRQLLAPQTVYAASPSDAHATHLLLRGSPHALGPEVAPGGLSCVSVPRYDMRFATAATSERDRRGALAKWITSGDHPLTARVIANRLWHYHFGRGLVETPNDLGFHGGIPSHPELLDWLAAELVAPLESSPFAKPWSLKHLHYLMVMSATYRQDSQARPEAMARDAENRWLWRKSPQRLDAESLRDAILQVSGQLNPTMGGPGFQDFRTYVFNSQFYEMLDPEGYGFQRRTIYRTWVRSGRNEFLDAFDCPDPSAAAPRRARTTTPLQALSLLNNSFVLRSAKNFAAAVESEGKASTDEFVSRVYKRAFARSPTDTERSAGAEFVDRHGLAAFCRVLFNSNEFLYVD